MKSVLKGIPSNIYSSLIDHNPDSIFILDKEGFVLDINLTVNAIFGYTPPEVIGKRCKIMSDETCNSLQGEFCTYHKSTYDKFGQILHLQVKSIPIFEDEGLVNVMIVAKDVTDVVETRIALQNTTEKLQTIYDSSADAMDIIDLDGNVVHVNKAFEDMYGWKAEEIIGKQMPTIPVARFEKVKDERENLKKEQYIKGLEVECLKKDGNMIPVSITISPLYDEDGKVFAFSSISRDITERKKMEAELIESKNKYKGLLNASPEPSYVQSEGVIHYINRAAVKLFGYNHPDELLGRHVLDFVHSDSYESVANLICKSVNEITIPEQTVFQKLLRKDRSTFIAEVIQLGIEYADMPAVHVILRDVTERKLVEEALIQSEEKYRLIAENMTDLVTVVDENGLITYASPSTSAVLGFTPDDYEGKPAFNKAHPDDLPNVRKMMGELLITKDSHEMEFRYKHKMKGWIWVEARGTYFEEKGQRFLLFVSRVIEEKKKMREQLKLMAFQDELTGLPNRRLFQKKIRETLEEAKRNQTKFALLYLDIDKFKWVNDNLGHSTGDELLKQFADRVGSALRKNDTLVRQGGDEFLVLLPDIGNVKNVKRTAERILGDLQTEWKVGEHSFTTTSSVGIAIFPKDGTTMDELLTNADFALYEAKEHGRNNYMMFS
ncbi:hypothetical protein SLU01_08710 [Sporosarcina luteola]|uniref:Diguanylate cyclase n=1 Tax=Sporosarcina luteola TaxID=582850 RepID=A0A511Z537_9BACL|nr:PAS domain S-box protein [Sporosarcina luteola]GEN82559.1 hypothetical protein SLU01_08710 [Sporosarcina luteola]